VLREQPQMMQEGMRAGAAIQEKRMDEIMIKVRARAEQLAEASDEKNGTQKK
jgi:hypothetical protein